MIKRYFKSLNKQTFEESMLVEFSQFLNGFMLRLDQMSKILSQLMLMQKSTHTSLSTTKNIKIKQERLEIDYGIEQCKIVEYQIDQPDLFHDIYHYERFDISALNS